ncbi:hypothetical protein BH11PSE8_BH11PSE8_36790 [soil metagenome]
MFTEPVDVADSSSGEPDWQTEVQTTWRLGLHQRGARWAVDALRAMRGDDVARRANAEFWAARHLGALGRFEEAVAHAGSGLARVADRHPELRAQLLCVLALCLSELGRNDEALLHAEAALALGTELDSPAGQSVALMRIGLCRWRLGGAAGAEPDFFRALSLAREAHDREELRAAYGGLVGVAIAVHDEAQAAHDAESARAALRRACGYAEQAVRVAERQNDVVALLASLNNQAKCLTMAGWLPLAESMLRDVERQAAARGLRMLHLRARYNLALLLMQAERHPEADEMLGSILALLDESEHVPMRLACMKAMERLARVGTSRSAQG